MNPGDAGSGEATNKGNSMDEAVSVASRDNSKKRGSDDHLQVRAAKSKKRVGFGCTVAPTYGRIQAVRAEKAGVDDSNSSPGSDFVGWQPLDKGRVSKRKWAEKIDAMDPEKALGKAPMSKMRVKFPHHVRGMAAYDPLRFSGGVKVDCKGTFNPLNAFGASVAMSYTIGGDKKFVAGRIIGQEKNRGQDSKVLYKMVFSTGEVQTHPEAVVRTYVEVFEKESTRGLKSIVVQLQG